MLNISVKKLDYIDALGVKIILILFKIIKKKYRKTVIYFKQTKFSKKSI
jgi:hypothetical protein